MNPSMRDRRVGVHLHAEVVAGLLWPSSVSMPADRGQSMSGRGVRCTSLVDAFQKAARE